jgi:mRNA interferase YafQ
MRQVLETKQYKKSFQRFMKSGFFDVEETENIIRIIALGLPLPLRQRNHKLIGNMKGRYECHIKPDLLLVYELDKEDMLILIDIGSHAEIFG